jgi:hypothetical protein
VIERRPNGQLVTPKGSPKRGGRKKGTPNKVTVEVKQLCSELVTDPAYLSKLKKRLHAGKLAPGVENTLWHYAFGKPKETVEHSGLGGEPIALIQRVIVDAAHPEA